MSWGVIYQLKTHNATTLGRGGLSKDKAYEIYNKLAYKEQTNFVRLVKDSNRTVLKWYRRSEDGEG